MSLFTPAQAHEFNLDSAQREIDSRSAEGEDMSTARVCQRTYAVIKSTTRANPQIIVKIKEVYGERKTYPVCVLAQEFARIAGTKTLTDSTIKSIRALGFGIIVEREELTA